MDGTGPQARATTEIVFMTDFRGFGSRKDAFAALRSRDPARPLRIAQRVRRHPIADRQGQRSRPASTRERQIMGGKLLNGRNASSKCVAALAIGALASLAAGQAMAGCGMPGGGGKSPQNWHQATAGQPWNDTVVGLWKLTFISDGTAYPGPIAAGVETDFGTAEWHPDGTEFMISGKRAPSTGDVCMGAWKRTGAHTFKLNHLALGWASSDSAPPFGPVSPAVFLGPAVFKETITLGPDGNTYEGPFTIDQYAADGTTLLEHIGGTVTGTRITAD
jgi:hypothetical protein